MPWVNINYNLTQHYASCLFFSILFLHTELNTMSIKTRIYCAGGAGTNLGTKLGRTHMTACYIDTSQSNRTEGLDPSLCHFVDGLDGSGKNRRENYAVITKEIDAILAAFEPGDFNIVLFSAAGGSGSVIGPLLLKGLLERRLPVVAVTVGADDSSITVTNTINTLKSMEAISAMVQQPVVMSYHENTPGVARGSVDGEVLFVLEALAELTSQENQELDTKDLTNWVQYQKVSPVTPQLSFLGVFDSRQSANAVVEPIAVASLYTDPSNDNPFGNPYYNTVGFPRNGEMEIAEQLHFVINIADVEENLRRLVGRQTELNKNYSGYRQRKSAVTVDDDLTSDGLVL